MTENEKENIGYSIVPVSPNLNASRLVLQYNRMPSLLLYSPLFYWLIVVTLWYSNSNGFDGQSRSVRVTRQ